MKTNIKTLAELITELQKAETAMTKKINAANDAALDTAPFNINQLTNTATNQYTLALNAVNKFYKNKPATDAPVIKIIKNMAAMNASLIDIVPGKIKNAIKHPVKQTVEVVTTTAPAASTVTNQLKSNAAPAPELTAEEKLALEQKADLEKAMKAHTDFCIKTEMAINTLKNEIPKLPRISTEAMTAINLLVMTLQNNYTDWHSKTAKLITASHGFQPTTDLEFHKKYQKLLTELTNSSKAAINEAMPILKQNLSFSDKFMNILREIGNLFIGLASAVKILAGNINNPYTLYQPVVVAGADKVEAAQAILAPNM